MKSRNRHALPTAPAPLEIHMSTRPQIETGRAMGPRPSPRSRWWLLLLAGVAGFALGQGLLAPAASPTVSAAPGAQPAVAGALDRRQAHAPAIGRATGSLDCVGDIEIRNLGQQPTVVALLGWRGEPLCPPHSLGPGHLDCSGLIAPGATWTMAHHDIPADLLSGSFYSLSTAPLEAAPGTTPQPIAAILCTWLSTEMVGDAEAYRHFKRAFDTGEAAAGGLAGIPATQIPGEPIEVIVRRDCDLGEGRRAASDYVAVSGDRLTTPELSGDLIDVTSAMLPFLVADASQLGSSYIHMHNSSMECAVAELWFAAFGKCMRRTICELRLPLGPGATSSLDLRACLAPGDRGVGWIRVTQPVSILVDTVGETTLPAYTHSARGARGLRAGGIARAAAGRTTLLHIANHDRSVEAKVELTFRRGETVDATLPGWVCPGGGLTVDPREISALPDGWQGQVDIISLPRPAEHYSPGWSPISGIVSVVEHPTPDQMISVGFARFEVIDSPLIEPIPQPHLLFMPIAWKR